MADIEEIWKPLDHPGVKTDYYYVSNLGRVKTTKKPNGLTLVPNYGGYLCVSCAPSADIRLAQVRYKKVVNMPVHRMIAKTFIPNPENKPTVDHIDGDIMNNRVSNL